MSVGLTGALREMKAYQQAKPELDKLKKATTSFEAIFAKNLISEMRKSTHEVSLGQSFGGDIYKDMMDQSLADSMASKGSLGIGNILYKSYAPKVVAMAQRDLMMQERQAKAAAVNDPNSNTRKV